MTLDGSMQRTSFGDTGAAEALEPEPALIGDGPAGGSEGHDVIMELYTVKMGMGKGNRTFYSPSDHRDFPQCFCPVLHGALTAPPLHTSVITWGLNCRPGLRGCDRAAV